MGKLRRYIPSSYRALYSYGIQGRNKLMFNVVSFRSGQSRPVTHGLEYHTAQSLAQQMVSGAALE